MKTLKLTRNIFILFSIVLSSCGQPYNNAHLEGAWLASCTNGNKYEAVFDREVFVINAIIDGDGDCQAGATLQWRGTYWTGDRVEAPKGAIKVDLFYDFAALTPRTAAQVESYNQNRLCGASDWSLNNAKFIRFLDCDGIDYPIAEYTIYSAGDNTLQFGRSSGIYDGSIASLRHIELGETIVYLRK